MPMDVKTHVALGLDRPVPTEVNGRSNADIVPSLSLTNKRVLLTATPDTSKSDAEPSLDIFYKLTPQLNASLTLNTDCLLYTSPSPRD